MTLCPSSFPPFLSFSLSLFFSPSDWEMKMKRWFRGEIGEFSFRQFELQVTADNPCKNVQQEEHSLKTEKNLQSNKFPFFSFVNLVILLLLSLFLLCFHSKVAQTLRKKIISRNTPKQNHLLKFNSHAY